MQEAYEAPDFEEILLAADRYIALDESTDDDGFQGGVPFSRPDSWRK